MFDQTFNFNCFNHLIISRSIKLIHQDWSDVQSNIQFQLFQSSNPITINQTNSPGSIGYSIKPSISIVPSLIDHLILSRSIKLIHQDRLDIRSNLQFQLCQVWSIIWSYHNQIISRTYNCIKFAWSFDCITINQLN